MCRRKRSLRHPRRPLKPKSMGLKGRDDDHGDNHGSRYNTSLFLIASWATSRCHEQFGDIAKRFPTHIAHSPSRWMMQPVFIEYLSFGRVPIPAGPICLVLDQCPTRFPIESQDAAARLQIRFTKVPKGAPGIWQPLDRRIYGAKKSKVRAR
jgi:hypothetical protein